MLGSPTILSAYQMCCMYHKQCFEYISDITSHWGCPIPGCPVSSNLDWLKLYDGLTAQKGPRQAKASAKPYNTSMLSDALYALQVKLQLVVKKSQTGLIQWHIRAVQHSGLTEIYYYENRSSQGCLAIKFKITPRSLESPVMLSDALHASHVV